MGESSTKYSDCQVSLLALGFRVPAFRITTFKVHLEIIFLSMASGLDSFQRLFQTCQRLDQELTSNLATPKSSSIQSKSQWRDEVQEALGRMELATSSLRQKLENTSNLTEREQRRREAEVSALEGRFKQLKMAFQQGGLGKNNKRREDEDRRRLLDSNIIDMGVDDNWSNNESESLIQPASSEATYRQYKEDALADQDRGLDLLHEVIVRNKNIAQNIQSEVQTHNDIIDDIDEGLERTTQRLITTTRTVETVSQRDKVWKYWLAIFFLLIVIIVIIAIPGKK